MFDILQADDPLEIRVRMQTRKKRQLRREADLNPPDRLHRGVEAEVANRLM
jgi:hypothetical protein